MGRLGENLHPALKRNESKLEKNQVSLVFLFTKWHSHTPGLLLI